MKAVLERVSQAQVTVGERITGEISAGFLVYVGIDQEDTAEQADWLVDKIIHLRVMADQRGKMNLSVLDTRGSILVVSQFTLCADTANRRPGFTRAAPPETAKKLYDYFIRKLKAAGITVASGVFGAYMQVSSVNDGPVTILLDSNTG